MRVPDRQPAPAHPGQAVTHQAVQVSCHWACCLLAGWAGAGSMCRLTLCCRSQAHISRTSWLLPHTWNSRQFGAPALGLPSVPPCHARRSAVACSSAGCRTPRARCSWRTPAALGSGGMPAAAMAPWRAPRIEPCMRWVARQLSGPGLGWGAMVGLEPARLRWFPCSIHPAASSLLPSQQFCCLASLALPPTQHHPRASAGAPHPAVRCARHP